jgi:hypothetical protein
MWSSLCWSINGPNALSWNLYLYGTITKYAGDLNASFEAVYVSYVYVCTPDIEVHLFMGYEMAHNLLYLFSPLKIIRAHLDSLSAG